MNKLLFGSILAGVGIFGTFCLTVLAFPEGRIRINVPFTQVEARLGEGVGERLTTDGRSKIERLTPSKRNLRNVNLRGENLGNADLRDADLRNADLRDADLRDADLRNSNLRCTDLRNAKLQNADLQDADLVGARGLDLAQVKAARNWKYARYDDDFRKKLGLPPDLETLKN